MIESPTSNHRNVRPYLVFQRSARHLFRHAGSSCAPGAQRWPAPCRNYRGRAWRLFIAITDLITRQYECSATVRGRIENTNEPTGPEKSPRRRVRQKPEKHSNMRARASPLASRISDATFTTPPVRPAAYFAMIETRFVVSFAEDLCHLPDAPNIRYHQADANLFFNRAISDILRSRYAGTPRGARARARERERERQREKFIRHNPFDESFGMNIL